MPFINKKFNVSIKEIFINFITNSIYDESGIDQYSFNKKRMHVISNMTIDNDGYNALGYGTDGYDRNGYDFYGFDKHGYDEYGYNLYGRDKQGYDREGYDKIGYNKENIDR